MIVLSTRCGITFEIMAHHVALLCLNSLQAQDLLFLAKTKIRINLKKITKHDENLNISDFF